MDRTFFEQPNEHYVARLMSASSKKTIVATDDIYDIRGVKLWARGRPITLSLQERLLATRLKKPIEMCLQVEDGIKPTDIVSQVRKLLDERPTIVKLGGNHSTKAIELFERIALNGLPSLLLSTTATDGSGAYEHAVMSALIAALLALRLNMPDSAVEATIMAGLTHDMGELYINPELLNARRELNFEEWKNIAVHPRVGAVMLAEFGKFPTTIVRAVQEHHERLDGSGYPSGTASEGISPLGQILMIAEVLSAILPARENPEARALLALRLVHQQFDRNIVGLLSTIYTDHHTSVPHGFNLQALTGVAQAINAQIKLCQLEIENICAQSELPESWAKIARHAHELCSFLAMSLHSTGVLSTLQGQTVGLQHDAGIANELHVVVTELKWRMRALSRHIALTASRLERAADAFEVLVQSLYLVDAKAVDSASSPQAGVLAV